MDTVDIRLPAARKPVNLPRNAEERAVALVDLTARLTAHIERETEAVRAHRPSPELDAIATAKQPLCFAYEELSRLLRIDRAGMAALDPELRDRLAEATKALAEASSVNARALRVAGEAQQTLVEAMVAAVNQIRQTQPGVPYGPSSATGRPLRGYGAPTRGPSTSATFNACL